MPVLSVLLVYCKEGCNPSLRANLKESSSFHWRLGSISRSLHLGNLTQWRDYQDWEEADLKYRALKMVLSSDDPNVSYIEKHFSVCRNENVIDDVRNRVAAYEDSVCRYREMVETAKYKDSIANKLLLESKEIRRIMEKPK